MPLVHITVYTIHNDLTRTALEFASPLRGWGSHGRQNQQWKAIADDAGWTLQNQGVKIMMIIIISSVASFLHRVFDLQADGMLIPLQALAPELSIQDGVYKIINFKTGTVFGFADDTLNTPVQGLVSRNGNLFQQWKVTEVNGDRSELRINNRFLGLGPAPIGTAAEPVARDERALHGRVEAQKRIFAIRRVPNTQFYKIFLDDNVGVSRFAVNLARIANANGPALTVSEIPTLLSFVEHN
ncbi:hypothetical protein F5887DRAFT_1162268 [Amanita rubescens]|nr:hypothetical protein F5887DRAFT_1162268 [Amanita rubescens]